MRKKKDMEFKERNAGWIFFIRENNFHDENHGITALMQKQHGDLQYIDIKKWRKSLDFTTSRACSFYCCRNFLSNIYKYSINFRVFSITMEIRKGNSIIMLEKSSPFILA